MTVTTPYFDTIRRMIQEQCGVVLEAEKDYLVKTLIEPSLPQWGYASLAELMTHLRENPHGEAGRRIVEALIPFETYFFRDPDFYRALEITVLPELIQKNSRKKELSIWSAACSSGQEPYSLVMLLKEKFPFLFGWKLSLLASDFSRGVIRRAREGRYNPTEVKRGLPQGYLEKYFVPQGGDWLVREEVRRAVEFREINLKGPWKFERPIDLILVRNVLIYFDIQMKKDILAKIRRALDPQGYLFLGSSETAIFLDGSLEGFSLPGGMTGYKPRG